MRKLAWLALMATGLFAQTVQQSQAHSTLKVGDTAPDFTLPATNNTKVTLADYRGKKNVVVAFFPAAFTGGWTQELTAYQSGIGKFDDANTQVIAISTDFIATLNHWAKELNASFPIASDHLGDVAKSYGVLNEQQRIANRTTFVVDMEGKIVNITENREAIDVSGALVACSRLKHNANK
jgi:peroxiredoxin